MKPAAPSLALAVVLILISPVPGADVPVTGRPVAGLEDVDRAVLRFLDTVGGSAATVAVARDKQLVYMRGYGWTDRARTRATPPDALLRIASLSKAITEAAIKDLVRAQRLTLNTPVFPFLEIQPAGGKPGDPRLGQITVRHLLEHKGGWDRTRAPDPIFALRRAEQELRLSGPATGTDLIRYMLTQPLQFDPGARSSYSNFGYLVLGRVIEKASGRSYRDYLRTRLFAPLQIQDIDVGRSKAAERPAREVEYPVVAEAIPLEVLDAAGGLIASAPALCRFFQHYWGNGEPRTADQRWTFTLYGSLPGTTALLRQRPDGVVVVVLCNGRRDDRHKEDNDTLQKAVDAALDKAFAGKSR